MPSLTRRLSALEGARPNSDWAAILDRLPTAELERLEEAIGRLSGCGGGSITAEGWKALPTADVEYLDQFLRTHGRLSICA